MLQLTYELRPKWKKNNNKTQNAVSRSDPLQGSDNHLSLTNGDSICHRCSDWLVNSGDDIRIGKSDRHHILVVVVAYMQLLSARDALFFRNCKVFGNS